MPRSATAILVILAALAFAVPSTAAARPDILFIIFDDMNDATSLHDPQSGIATPNLERLARRGVFFRRAYCAAPSCNLSRTATLTGIRPSASGVYSNADLWREALLGRKSLPAAFGHHGYHVRGAGEIFHAGPGTPFFDPEAFAIYHPLRILPGRSRVPENSAFHLPLRP
jgi:arylsulfatase A-like enzyme